MKTSVIIPSYNHEKYVADAIRSVLHQDHSDLELIVVDDGSSDGSIEAIESVFGEFPSAQTRLHRQSNQGAHSAINQGIELASGELITLLNSDDSYAPDRLDHLLAAAEKQEIFFICTGVNFIDESGEALNADHAHSAWYTSMADEIENSPTFGFSLLRHNISVTSGNFAFSRALYDRVGPFAGYKFCHDWDFMMRATRLVEPQFIDLPLLNYRAHGSNSTHALRDIQEQEVTAALNCFLRLCAQEGAPNELAPCPENWESFFEVFARKNAFHFNSRSIASYIEAN
ncbi:MAG: glycosyltransferase [Myxococcota bacterium]|nr:glycosyltransferase [Myxococcota bacterium]